MMSRESFLLLLFCSIFIHDDLLIKLVLVPGKEEDLIDDDDVVDEDDENKDELRREAFITTAFIAAALVHTDKEDAILCRINE